MKSTKHLPNWVIYLLKVYLTGIAFFTFFRIVFFIAHLETANEVPFTVLLKAFFMGWRFDTVISCYLLLIPFLFLAINSFVSPQTRFYRQLNYFFLICYSVAFLICASDIPYYSQFNSRFSYAAFSWADNPLFVLKLVFTEPNHYPYLLIFLITAFLFFRTVKRWNAKYTENHKITFAANTLAFIMLGGLIFLGIRGRVEKKSPIRWGTAFFSEYAFANQMGLNPVFTLIRSTLDAAEPGNKMLQFMPDEQALHQAGKYLGREHLGNGKLAKNIITKGSSAKYNIVVVLMESMSAEYMTRFGNQNKLTPVLDSLANESVFFSDFYSAGIHTFNGIHSTMYSVPALMGKHPMKNFENMNVNTGLPIELKKHGYQTLYFCTHDAQFDNMSGYLLANGIQQVISENDFPASEALSTLGVPDHVLLNKVTHTLSSLKEGSPFLAVVLTASNHSPIIIPDDIPFRPSATEGFEPAVQYADWSIGNFLSEAKKEAWYDSTLFVFLGDHGRRIKPIYDLAISYHHIPLLIHAPRIFTEPNEVTSLGCQIDLFPTLMGILDLAYINNTVGVDLLNESREFAYFSADDKLGCMNDTCYYVQRNSDVHSLYFYRKKDRTDYIGAYPHLAEKMKNYAESMLQGAQALGSVNK
ncbi:MAG: hypothetical protein COA57_06635 [Flavobacteriales bacterium]|nr:MAG: hypothetical protein COA57_06635 [Flavobacteriales bacterium]